MNYGVCDIAGLHWLAVEYIVFELQPPELILRRFKAKVENVPLFNGTKIFGGPLDPWKVPHFGR